MLAAEPLKKKKVPKQKSIGVKDRIPDSEHLVKMREYLVNKHKNSAFISALTNGGLIPDALKRKLQAKYDFGDSLQDLLLKQMQCGQNQEPEESSDDEPLKL